MQVRKAVAGAIYGNLVKELSEAVKVTLVFQFCHMTCCIVQYRSYRGTRCHICHYQCLKLQH